MKLENLSHRKRFRSKNQRIRTIFASSVGLQNSKVYRIVLTVRRQQQIVMNSYPLRYHRRIQVSRFESMVRTKALHLCTVVVVFDLKQSNLSFMHEHGIVDEEKR